jgi:hypothetical protein
VLPCPLRKRENMQTRRVLVQLMMVNFKDLISNTKEDD